MLKKFDFETQNFFFFQTIRNGSNPVFEPNILAGVEGLEPSRTVLEVVSN